MKSRLNNFVLWCKGWYTPKEKHVDIFDQLRLILMLDGYGYIKHKTDVLSIIIKYFGEYCDEMKSNNYFVPFGRIDYFISEQHKYMKLYELDEYDAIIFVIKQSFFDDNKIELIGPVKYNKSFPCVPMCVSEGMTYKEMNKIAKKHFKITNENEYNLKFR